MATSVAKAAECSLVFQRASYRESVRFRVVDSGATGEG